jgi:ubiquinone/menaquinone biosynthesis C-methylase UbiE
MTNLKNLTIWKNIENILKCPKCSGELKILEECNFECKKCHHKFTCENGIPMLFWPNKWDESTPDVTEVVKQFYEKNPFPNYDDTDSAFKLKEKAKKSIFAKLLDEQIPYKSNILEIGCGTGQLTNYLGMTYGRTVIGTDICFNSLNMANQFKEANDVNRAAFCQMNLFKPIFKDSSFDFVISNGVLHHTSDAFLAFKTISKLVKKNGFIIIGLYNKYGRLPTDIRRLVFKFSKNRLNFLDSRIREKNLNESRKNSWFMDQYKHPHESKHTFDEILDWFDKTGFEFITSIPKSTAFDSFSDEENLFAPAEKGSKLDHFLVQTNMLLSGGKEGGLFIMIGRKKNN